MLCKKINSPTDKAHYNLINMNWSWNFNGTACKICPSDQNHELAIVIDKPILSSNRRSWNFNSRTMSNHSHPLTLLDVCEAIRSFGRVIQKLKCWGHHLIIQWSRNIVVNRQNCWNQCFSARWEYPIPLFLCQMGLSHYSVSLPDGNIPFLCKSESHSFWAKFWTVVTHLQTCKSEIQPLWAKT